MSAQNYFQVVFLTSLTFRNKDARHDLREKSQRVKKSKKLWREAHRAKSLKFESGFSMLRISLPKFETLAFVSWNGSRTHRIFVLKYLESLIKSPNLPKAIF